MIYTNTKIMYDISFKQFILALVLNNVVWLFLFFVFFDLFETNQGNNIELMNKLLTQQQVQIESLETMIKLLSNKSMEPVVVGWTLPVLSSEWYGFLWKAMVFTTAGLVCCNYVYSWVPVLQLNWNTIVQYTGFDYLFNTNRVLKSFNYLDGMNNIFTIQFSPKMEPVNLLIKPCNSLVTSTIDEFFRNHHLFFIEPVQQAVTTTLDIVAANPETTITVVEGINAVWGNI